MFGFIGKIFGAVGGLLGKMFGFIKSNITEEQLQTAIQLVERAAVSQLSNPEKAKWVADQLMGIFHINQSLANLIVEMAIQAFKYKLNG